MLSDLYWRFIELINLKVLWHSPLPQLERTPGARLEIENSACLYYTTNNSSNSSGFIVTVIGYNIFLSFAPTAAAALQNLCCSPVTPVHSIGIDLS